MVYEIKNTAVLIMPLSVMYSTGLDDRLHYATPNCQIVNLLNQKGFLIQSKFTALSYVRQSWMKKQLSRKQYCRETYRRMLRAPAKSTNTSEVEPVGEAVD